MKIFHGKTAGISSTPIASTTKKNVNSLKIDVLFFLVTHFVTHFSFREEEKAAPPAIVIGLWGCCLVRGFQTVGMLNGTGSSSDKSPKAGCFYSS